MRVCPKGGLSFFCFIVWDGWKNYQCDENIGSVCYFFGKNVVFVKIFDDICISLYYEDA